MATSIIVLLLTLLGVFGTVSTVVDLSGSISYKLYSLTMQGLVLMLRNVLKL